MTYSRKTSILTILEFTILDVCTNIFLLWTIEFESSVLRKNGGGEDGFNEEKRVEMLY